MKRERPSARRRLGGACEDDLARAEHLREIVRRKADAPLRQIEAEFEPHRPAQPGIAAGVRRPGAFVEAAEHHAVDVCRRASSRPKMRTRALALSAAPFGAAANEQAENIRIVDRGELKRRGGLAVLNGFESALQLQAVGVGVGSNSRCHRSPAPERFGVALRQLA